MKYSLVSKFQGAYVGYFLGKKILNDNQLIHTNISSIIQEIIDKSENDFALWKKYNCNLTNLSDIIIGFLPWILYYHDNWHQLKDLIIKVGNLNNLENEDIELLEIWIYEFVLILREKLDIRHPVKQLTNVKQLKHSFNLKLLNLIEISLSQGISSKQFLETLLTQTSNLYKIELLFSLYLFWSVPEDFFLTIKRGVSVADRLYNTVSLTGILIGAYNSLSGIPLYYLNLIQNNQVFIDDLAMIKKIFIFWSGIYHYDRENFALSLIATPKTFQPRSSLQIISQEQYR